MSTRSTWPSAPPTDTWCIRPCCSLADISQSLTRGYVSRMSAVAGLAPSSSAQQREHQLIRWIQDHDSLLLGYSGGVASAYLACVAIEAVGPERVLAVIGRSASYPAEQGQTARDVAARSGISVLEVDTHEIDDPRYVANPANRCYFCKTELWSVLERVRAARGIATIIDGTNADALSDYRQGKKAAAEQRVRSPLAELDFTKSDIRELTRVRAIPTWTQPSSPCQSSRLPYGTPVTIARLSSIERAEHALRELGGSGYLRVRHHGDTSRVEMDLAQLEHWQRTAEAAELCGAVQRAGFAHVVL